MSVMHAARPAPSTTCFLLCCTTILRPAKPDPEPEAYFTRRWGLEFGLEIFVAMLNSLLGFDRK